MKMSEASVLTNLVPVVPVLGGHVVGRRSGRNSKHLLPAGATLGGEFNQLVKTMCVHFFYKNLLTGMRK